MLISWKETAVHVTMIAAIAMGGAGVLISAIWILTGGPAPEDPPLTPRFVCVEYPQHDRTVCYIHDGQDSTMLECLPSTVERKDLP